MAGDVRLGGARIDLRANSTQLVSEVRKATNALNRKGRAVRNVRRGLGRFTMRLQAAAAGVIVLRGAVAALAGGGGLTLLARRQAQYGATLLETSRRTGFTVEQLQLLGRVFEGDGATIEQTNKSLERFLRSVSEAAAGVGEYEETFLDLNINVGKFIQMGGTQYELLQLISSRLSEVSNQADRARIAYDIFGRSGIILLTALQRGDEDLREQIENFRRFGLVSEEQAATLKALEQSYADLGNVIKVAFAQSIAGAAEDLTAFNDVLAQRIPEAIRQLIPLLQTLADNATAAGVATGAILGGLRGVAGGPGGVLTGAVVGGAVGGALANLNTIRTAFIELTQLSRQSLIDRRAELQIALASAEATVDSRTIPRRSRFRGAGPTREQRIAAVAQPILDEIAAIDARLEELDQEAEELSVAPAIKNIASAVVDTEAQFDDLLKSLRELAGGTDLFAERIATAAAEARGLRDGQKFAMNLREELRLAGEELRITVGASAFEEGSAAQARYLETQRVLNGFKTEELRLQREVAASTGNAQVEAQNNLDAHRATRDEIAKEANLAGRIAAYLAQWRIDQEAIADSAADAEREYRELITSIERINEQDALNIQIGTEAAQDSINDLIEQVRTDAENLELRIQAADFEDGSAAQAAFIAGQRLRNARHAEELDIRRRILSTNTQIADQARAELVDFQKTVPVFENLALATERNAAATATWTLNQRRLAEETRRAEQAADRFGVAVGRSLSSIILDGASAEDAIKGLVRELINAITQALIIQPIVAAITSAASGFLGGFADGGYAGRGLAVVGERGPELVDFQNPAQVYSTDRLRDAVGGGGSGRSSGIVFNFAPNIQGGATADGVREEIAAAYEPIRQGIIGELLRERNRNSQIRDALR